MSTDTFLGTPPRGYGAIAGAEVTARAHELQQRADALFGLYGRAADPPRAAESDTQYTRRILQSAARYSTQWAGVDFDRLPASALPTLIRQVIDGGVETFKRSGPGCGELREATEYDHSGRKLIKFYGDPEFCWGPIKAMPQYVTGWNTELGKGANAPGAVRPVGTLMSDGTVRRA